MGDVDSELWNESNVFVLCKRKAMVVRKDYSSTAKRRRAKKVYRFRITHRQTAGYSGPGRRHKSRRR